jgi:hypothetical protein
MVAARDLKSLIERCAGSIPAPSTRNRLLAIFVSRKTELLQFFRESKDFSMTIQRVRKVPAEVVDDSHLAHNIVAFIVNLC